MEIKTAMAGTLESGDIFIQIAPNDNAGLHIDLESTVAYQFGDQIKKVITETLQGLGIDQAEVKATDKGALDCTTLKNHQKRENCYATTQKNDDVCPR